MCGRLLASRRPERDKKGEDGHLKMDDWVMETCGTIKQGQHSGYPGLTYVCTGRLCMLLLLLLPCAVYWAQLVCGFGGDQSCCRSAPARMCVHLRVGSCSPALRYNISCHMLFCRGATPRSTFALYVVPQPLHLQSRMVCHTPIHCPYRLAYRLQYHKVMHSDTPSWHIRHPSKPHD